MSISDLETGVDQLDPAAPAVDDTHPRQREALWRSLTHGQGLLGLVLVAVIVVAGVLAPLLAAYDPLTQIPGANLLGPSADHWLGTDQVNRDVASRVLYGIRISLVIAVLSVPVGAVLGGLLGLVATSHPFADVVTQRVFDIVLAFPALILGIMAAAIIGPGQVTVGVVIAAAEVPVFGRLVRTSVLTVREQPFVEAAEVIGARRWWILRTHVLPNAIESAGVQIALSLSLAVFVEAAMSFIGIGVRPPEPSLGSLVADSIPNLDANPAYAIGPLVVVSLLVLGFLLIAQALGKARRS